MDASTIGGAAPGEGNVIAHNSSGIDVGGTTGVRIRGNRIFDNRVLGIDLSATFDGDGVTPNDTEDGDSGPNDLQNYPMITSVVPGASTTHIEGLLNSIASAQFDIDLFSNPACQLRPQDYLQGETYLGSVVVVTNGFGNAVFATDVPFVLQPGQPVTATATDFFGNTSEFSQRTIFSMDPRSGPSGGQLASTLTGMLFEQGATVSVGGVAATNVNVVSPESITATMPSRPAGSVNDVTVLDPSGVVGTLRNGWVSDFLDVPDGQLFHVFVIELVANGVTAGVGGGLYGVDQPTLRQQMAVFLLKGKHGLCYTPPACTGMFRRRSVFLAVCVVDRRPGRGRNHGWLRRWHLLPGKPGAPGPDGGLPLEGRARIELPAPGLRPAGGLPGRAVPGRFHRLDRAARRREHHRAVAAAATTAPATPTPAGRWRSSS